jgi:hypothetical protein
MAFVGKDPVGCEILVDNKCLQVKKFKYVGCEIPYKN